MTRRRRLGVVGTLVWDRIFGYGAQPGAPPTEDWGGLAYSLAAAAAACPPGWEIVPVLKIGHDLKSAALEFLRSIRGLSLEGSVLEVPEPNNRVELRYLDAARRHERLTGGVPAWTWSELEPIVGGLDALYVNFISGFELNLPDARLLRVGFGGPIYADLHSLLLGRGPDGGRTPQPLVLWREWLSCFDAVQVNEDELRILAAGAAHTDPWHFAEGAVRQTGVLFLVTLGERGASYVAARGWPADPLQWPAQRRHFLAPSAVLTGLVPPADGPVRGDPTGCGDVWGSTVFASLLGGALLEEAISRAHRAAARNVLHQGASGLFAHLAASDSLA
jgi:hypothetical protein